MISSLYTIIAFYFLNLVPHFQSVMLIRSNNNGKWSNAAPHSSSHQSKVRSSVKASCFAQYERARRAHNNGLETLPLVVAAALASEMAALNPAMVNCLMAIFLGLRSAYIATYIIVDSERWSHLRTLFYAVSTLELLFLLAAAANVLSTG